MATGSITEWDDGLGEGLITEPNVGVHDVDRQDCSAQAKLKGKTIPPGGVPVTFQLAVGNKAINVDG